MSNITPNGQATQGFYISYPRKKCDTHNWQLENTSIYWVCIARSVKNMILIKYDHKLTTVISLFKVNIIVTVSSLKF